MTFVVSLHWNCLIERQFQGEPTTYVTENKEESYLEIYTFQASCPLSLPLLNIPNCQSVLKFLPLYYKLFIHCISMTVLAPNSSPRATS